MTNKKKPKTVVQRKAEERERRRKAGFILWQIWIRPEWREVIQGVIDKLK